MQRVFRFHRIRNVFQSIRFESTKIEGVREEFSPYEIRLKVEEWKNSL